MKVKRFFQWAEKCEVGKEQLLLFSSSFSATSSVNEAKSYYSK
jgi:hypothetical protein